MFVKRGSSVRFRLLAPVSPVASNEIFPARQTKRAGGGALVLIPQNPAMNSPKNLALVVLALAAVGGAVLAWKQQMELQTLRAAALGGDDRDELKRRALAAEKRAASLEGALAAAQDKLNEAKAAPVAKAEPGKRPDAAGSMSDMRAMMSTAANMMNNPEIQKMMALRQKAALDQNYATLFKHLGLPSDTLERLKQLMVERQQVGSDVFSAAAQQGLDPMQNRRELAKLTTDGQAKVDGEIKSLLGDDGYANYHNYQTTLPQRNLVNQLQQSLSYTPTPLSDTQAEQLVQILAQNAPARPATADGQPMVITRNAVTSATGGQPGTYSNVTHVITGSVGGSAGDVSFVGPAMSFGGAQVTDAAVDASRSVLTDPQVAALQQIQQQQAQMRGAMQPMGGGQPGQGGAAVFQFRSATAEGPPPPPPASGEKPPGGG